MKNIRVHTYRRRRLPRNVSQKSVVFRGDIERAGKPGVVGGQRAIVKRPWYPVRLRSSVVREVFLAEAAVDTLDDLLEFDVVPPTAMRDIGEIVSVQEYVPDARPWASLTTGEMTRVNRRDLIKIAVIDIIVHQGDRGFTYNLLVTPDWHAWAIDNENVFYYEVNSIAYDMVHGSKIPPDILRKLKNLQKEDFVTAFAGAPKEEVEAAWRRKVALEQTGEIHDPG